MASRLVSIDASTTAQKIQSLAPIDLFSGRVLSGVVTGTAGPIPYSRLRFFSVSSAGANSMSALLGTAIADERGKYQVVLPSAAGTP